MHLPLFPLTSEWLRIMFIFTAKNSKKGRFGKRKMTTKIYFFEFWGVLVSKPKFSSFFVDFVPLGLGTFVKDF